MNTDFLTRMADSSRRRLEESRARCDETSLRDRAESRPAAALLNLSGQGFDLIAEIKRRSPSMGELADDAVPPVATVSRKARAKAKPQDGDHPSAGQGDIATIAVHPRA